MGKKKENTTKEEDKRKLLIEYKDTLKDVMKAKKKTYITGKGIGNSNQLIDRLKLLGGSIMAGNNGVVPEFTQIARYLNLINVLPTEELNKIMKTMKIYLGMR